MKQQPTKEVNSKSNDNTTVDEPVVKVKKKRRQKT